jgi:NADH-quinone oxidoreductase subunit G/NADP-reducing hydrogenase subunit HndD
MKINLNRKEIEVMQGKTILDICKENGIDIPNLCVMENIKPDARCRVCIVEADGKLVTSCSTFPREGMVIFTGSEKAVRARRLNLELLMPEHMKSCSINPNENELCKIVNDIKLTRIRFEPIRKYKEDPSESVIRDDNKCINCGKCIHACSDIMAVHAIDFINRGHNEHVSPYFGHNLHNVACIKCGQCVLACPVSAIYEREHLNEVMEALNDPKKHVVVQTAPAVRAALGEEFGFPPGTIVRGKMVAALRKIGFAKIFDTNFAADLTIMEEGSELLERVKNGGPFPMFTSCCPGWVKFAEHFSHDLIDKNLLSSCKSPQEMLGALAKSYYAEKNNLAPDDIVVVSIMPCTAKKFEANRRELKEDVDYVLTTRELAKLIRQKNIDFANLPDEEYDKTLGMSTGAAAIFGVTGGVMEAALRTAYELATGKTLAKIDFEETRGLEGIKTGSVNINGLDLKFAVAHGGANIRKLLLEKDKFHFIEIMACPGGCIGGGGQPYPTDDAIRKKRIEGIYGHDVNFAIRKSHENPEIKLIYSEYLGKPLGERSHHLLHTKYEKRSEF